MALIFIDSYEHYTTGFADKGYNLFSSTTPTINTTAGRRGGHCARHPDGGILGTFKKTFLPSSFGAVVGMAINFEKKTDDNVILEFENSSGTRLASADFQTDGTVRIILGGTVKATTAADFLTINTYQYYELKYVPDLTTGIVELRINEAVVLTFSGDTITGIGGGDTQPTIAQFPTSAGASDGFILMDDLYILDTDPGTDNKDYLGDIRVDCHFASAEGSENGFSPSQGTDNSNMVDDNPNPDDDTTYVQAGTVSDTELYSVDTASLGTTVFGIQQVTMSRKTDAGTVDMQHVTRQTSGSNNKLDQSNRLVGDDYVFFEDIHDNDPDTGSDWTDTSINSSEFGYKIKAVT